MATSIWDAEASSSRASRSRVVDDDTVYVAVGKDVAENKLNLLWAVENFTGKRFYILHVHQPAKTIPLVGGTFPASRLKQNEMSEFQELERKIMRNILDDYILLCDQADVHAEKLCVEMDDIAKGIVKLIYQYNIKNLVMGAAANKHYSEGMLVLKSKKAIYVQQWAPLSCRIWYICKGYFIDTWGGDSTHSSNGFGDSASFLQQRTEESGLELEVSQFEENNHSLEEWERSSIDQLCAQLERAMSEAEKFKREAFEESIRRGQAEKTAIRAKLLESLYAGELRSRKETEEALAREKEDHHRTKKQLDEERVVTKDQRLIQQLREAGFDNRMNEKNDEILSALEQCKEYEKERDELQVERDNLLKLTEELSKKQAEDASSSQIHQFLPAFSLSEVEEATCNRDPLLRIGEGRYGNIYKGSLYRTPVAIEVLNRDNMQGPLDFQQEVDSLGKLRHPNLALLIGACSEACALIYEYLPNGSLEDRLSCKDNTPPLPWQVRIRIATELCSVLVFLHSSSPHSIVHGDLKSGNVLLDANFTCKLRDFGICPAFSHRESSQYHEHSLIHLDPYFLRTGELSPKSDTYSFGIILLQLLTGKSALNIVTEIRDVIDEENLISFLDALAGDWPFVQAKQLTCLALNCCATNQNSRPDLGSEVWRVLEPMRLSCSMPNQYSEENEQPPSHFLCPILQEVMQDPCVAADGFTYEEEALTGWLESGHDTSPMTNLQLQNLNLIPNRSLRSAIQEWMEIHEANS